MSEKPEYVPRIVRRLPDGASVWQTGDRYLVSWDAVILSESHYDGAWFDSLAAALSAWDATVTLSDQSLEELLAVLKDIKDNVTRKPTKVVIPWQVRRWMSENGHTVQDVIDMVKKANK